MCKNYICYAIILNGSESPLLRWQVGKGLLGERKALLGFSALLLWFGAGGPAVFHLDFFYKYRNQTSLFAFFFFVCVKKGPWYFLERLVLIKIDYLLLANYFMLLKKY